MTGSDESALDRFRGGFAGVPLSVRRVAGLLDAPGCARRRVIDAAGVPIDQLAELLDCPPGRQSPFAHARTRMFTDRCTGADMAPLLALARETLGVPVATARVRDLSAPRADLRARAEATRREFAAMLSGEAGADLCVLRQPVLTVRVNGRPVLVAADMVAYTTVGPLHPVEIRSFACVDGVADPGQVAQAARQIAVSVLAVRQSADDLGQPADRVATRGLLVMPENFSLSATGAVLDVAPQLRRLARLLAELPDPADLLAERGGVALPAPVAADADPAERRSAAAQAAEAVGGLPSRFGDGCTGCPLFTFCRHERTTAAAVERVGSDAANLCGAVATVDHALGLADGSRSPADAGELAVAEGLSRAAAALELVR